MQAIARATALLAVMSLAACQRPAEVASAPRLQAASPVAPAITLNASAPVMAAAVADPLYLASAASPFAAGCEGEVQAGTNYVNAEVEPYLAIHPADPQRMVGVWQQDRWSNGSSRGVMSATTLDGGQTWTRRPIPFSRCGGGTAANGGNFSRVSNPWVAYGGNGVVHAVGLASSGVIFQTGSRNAIVASRSLDDGRTWSNPIALISDGPGFFNDKDAIIVDPADPLRVYAVWDRLVAGDNGGPTYLARSLDGGASWLPARPIYDPGPHSQTISNVLVVLPDGTLATMFVQIDYAVNGNAESARIAVVRSFDKGATWTTPSVVANLQSVGTRDPSTGNPVRDQSIIPSIAVSPTGKIYVVWQDSRFDGGVRDAIVISHSSDGGAQWLPPTRVSTAAGVAAFNPAVHVRSDGAIGVSYYDFRSDGAAATLLTDTWLAYSSDGSISWNETRIADPFDLAMAPRTSAPFDGGYFLGDYQGLSSRSGVFVPFFAKANNANTTNRTDIFAAPTQSLVIAPPTRFAPDYCPPLRGTPSAQAQAAMQSKVSANLRRARQQRFSAATGQPPPRGSTPFNAPAERPVR